MARDSTGIAQMKMEQGLKVLTMYRGFVQIAIAQTCQKRVLQIAEDGSIVLHAPINCLLKIRIYGVGTLL